MYHKGCGRFTKAVVSVVITTVFFTLVYVGVPLDRNPPSGNQTSARAIEPDGWRRATIALETSRVDAGPCKNVTPFLFDPDAAAAGCAGINYQLTTSSILACYKRLSQKGKCVQSYVQRSKNLTLGLQEKKMAAQQASLEQLWCRTLNVMGNGGFCVSEHQLVVGGNNLFDPMMCSAIESLAGNGSVGDLGAGLGWYGMCLLKRTEVPFAVSSRMRKKYMKNYKRTMGKQHDETQVVYSWDGYDGAGNIEELSRGFIRQADLSEENLWLGRRWDWVMSVEVGEHISASREAVLLDNIVRHACRGVLLTWAVEGQDGHQHVNTRNNDYIKARMQERGLVNDIKEENRIRTTLTLGYLKATTMVFRFPEPKDCLLQ